MAFYAVTSIVACAIISIVTADIMKLHFPSHKEKDLFPRVKIKASFTSLTSFTLCLWIKPSFDGREMTVFNYGVPGQDKEIILSVEESVFRLYVGGSPLLDQSCVGYKPLNLVSGAWHHICIIWTNTKSTVQSFVDGNHCSSVSSEYSAHIIPGRGIMVLGQALKGLETDFHKNKSWNGDIAGVQMWDEVLSNGQIVNLGKCRGNLEGNVVSWMKTPMIASDQVALSSANVCAVLQKL